MEIKVEQHKQTKTVPQFELLYHFHGSAGDFFEVKRTDLDNDAKLDPRNVYFWVNSTSHMTSRPAHLSGDDFRMITTWQRLTFVSMTDTKRVFKQGTLTMDAENQTGTWNADPKVTYLLTGGKALEKTIMSDDLIKFVTLLCE